MRSRSFRPLAILVLCLSACLLGANPLPSIQGDSGDISVARQEFNQRLVALSEDDAEGLFALGVEFFDAEADMLEDLERLELASRAFRNALQADPVHPQAAEFLKFAEKAHEDIFERSNPNYWNMLFAVIGGLGLFLMGMKNMSEGIQAIAGNRMRRMINAVTDNRLLAVGVGIGVTSLVQSSSITTVIVVGLVNSALMQLHQAIGVIMGANIGTTITGWILVFKVGKYGLPILGVSVFVYLFSKRDSVRYLAMSTLGLGLIFFGLEMMKKGFEPMKDVPMFTEALTWFVAESYIGVLKCAAIGCVLTFLVQSSSATLAITIGLASTGVIPFETAAALVLGENIGTTITAWLASIGTTTVAKRAAYAHVLFNLLGVFWITLLFSHYLPIVGQVVKWELGVNPIGLGVDTPNFALIVTAGIATTHTLFNVTNTLLFVPFLRPFARFLERIIPDRGEKEVPHLTSLDIRLVDSPILAIENSRGEIIKMTGGVRKMLDWNRELLISENPDEELVKKLFNREQIMDNVQEEVIQFLTLILTSETPRATALEARQQLRIVDEFESISDYISAILKARLKLVQGGLELAHDEQSGLIQLHDRVADYVGLISEAFAKRGSAVLPSAMSEADAITRRVKEMRNAHLISLSEKQVDPTLSMAYSTMLNGYRKVKDHALNVAESLADKQ